MALTEYPNGIIITGSGSVSDALITGANNYGDAISIFDLNGTVTVNHCFTSGFFDFGIFAYFPGTGTVIISNSYIAAEYPVQVDDATLEITNCLIRCTGGDLVIESYNNAGVTIQSCTLVGTSAAIDLENVPDGSTITIKNNNIYNSIGIGSGGVAITIYKIGDPISATINNNNTYGWDTDFDLTGCSLGTGNIDVDPLFSSSGNSGDYLDGYYLNTGSDCINAGDADVSGYGWVADYPYAQTNVIDTGTIEIGFHYPSGGSVEILSYTFYETIGVQTLPQKYYGSETVIGGATTSCVLRIEPTIFDKLHDFFGNKVGF